MSSKDDCEVVSGSSFLAQTLRQFYTKERIENILIPLIRQSGPISLRTLDWLVVNYSKKYNISCKTKKGELFNIHNGYKISLSVYRRRNFDPFRRRERHSFSMNDSKYETTIGQANFIYWAYMNGVLDYAYIHAHAIELDMNTFSNAHKLKIKEMKKRGIIHKRTSLTNANPVKCHVYHLPTTVSFSVTDGSK